MDRSFLSQDDVIRASRKYVCIRLTTYENQEEAKFMQRLNQGRGRGSVENTTFAVLSPDTQEIFVRASRSPQHLYRSSSQLAKHLDELAAKYDGQPTVASLNYLPLADNVRIGINIAACDKRPLALLYASDEKNLEQLKQRLAKVAWSNDYIGKFIYAATTDLAEVSRLENAELKEGVFLVQPGEFGLTGTVLASYEIKQEGKEADDALRTALANHKLFERAFRSHVMAGQEQGVFWETKVPVTDRMESAARSRTKAAIERRSSQ